jgi:hypothetical protein
MAYVDFYCQTTGSNLNAGTSTSDTAVVTVAGTYSYSGNGGVVTFTATSGTPFSAVSVGMWASVCSASDTVTTFVSKILSIGGSGASITFAVDDGPPSYAFIGSFFSFNSGQFGTNLSATVRVGGAWASPVPVLNAAISGTISGGFNTLVYYSVGTPRLNIKAGTYSSSVSWTFGVSGASAKAPVFWRGYNATPGDLDNVANPGTHPLISFSSTASLSILAYNRLENIDITTSGTANPLVSVSGLGVMLTRCRVTATSGAITIAGAGFDAWACYFATTSTTITNTYCGSNGGLPRFLQCVFQGGLYNVTLGYQGSFLECVLKNPTSHHVYSTAASQGSIFHRPTFYNSGASADAINIASNIQYLTISYPIFANISRYAINVPDTSFVGLRIVGADYYSITSGQLNGVYESYQHAAITESASPFTSASTNDFTLVSTSTAVNQTFTFEMP